MEVKTLTMQEKKAIVSDLEHLSQVYEGELETANEKVAAAERERNELRAFLDSTMTQLARQRERFGPSIVQTTEGKFAGLPVREAAIRVIKERAGQPITLQEIGKVLEENRYPILSDHPSRSLHAALIGEVKAPDAKLEKVEAGTYRWRQDGARGGDA